MHSRRHVEAAERPLVGAGAGVVEANQWEDGAWKPKVLAADVPHIYPSLGRRTPVISPTVNFQGIFTARKSRSQ